MHALYLTADERKRFEQLPLDVREGWEIAQEEGDSYESVRQIQVRYSLSNFSFHPEVAKMVEKIVQGGPLDAISLEHLSPEVHEEVFFAIGARGVRSLIETLLPEVKDDADVELLATLSEIRHKLLELNSSATHR